VRHAVVGILLIAHAPLAAAMAAAAAHVYACAPERAGAQLRVFDVQPDSDTAANVDAARALLREIDTGSGVLVLTDAFGASPGNVAAQLAEPGRVAVIAGVNLPMLLRALCYRDDTLAEIAEKALAGGSQGVMQVASTAVQHQGVRPAQGDDLARLHHQQ
jgi:PTS system ascorbate-specific IIA component